MQKVELSEKQMIAILIANYNELSVVLASLPPLKKISDDEKRRQRILDDLKFILVKGLGHDPNKKNLYSVFETK